MNKLTPGNARWIGQRSEQQDAFGFAGFRQDYFRAHGGVLAVVADGMGGMQHGGEASQLAVQTMLTAYLEKRPDEPIADALVRAVTTANEAVYALACRSDGEGSVGTTLVAAAVQDERVFWVGVGDSRLYLFRAADCSLTQCTQDHNYGNELLLQVAAGEMSLAAVKAHPDREALTSFLGLAEIPKIDSNLQPLQLAAGDRLLLCSDGIHGVLTVDEISSVLRMDAQAAADALIAAVQAKGRGQQDNATVAILGLDGEVESTGRGRDRAGGRAGGRARGRRTGGRVLAAAGLLLAFAVLLGGLFWSDSILRWLGMGEVPDVMVEPPDVTADMQQEVKSDAEPDAEPHLEPDVEPGGQPDVEPALETGTTGAVTMPPAATSETAVPQGTAERVRPPVPGTMSGETGETTVQTPLEPAPPALPDAEHPAPLMEPTATGTEAATPETPGKGDDATTPVTADSEPVPADPEPVPVGRSRPAAGEQQVPTTEQAAADGLETEVPRGDVDVPVSDGPLAPPQDAPRPSADEAPGASAPPVPLPPAATDRNGPR